MFAGNENEKITIEANMLYNNICIKNTENFYLLHFVWLKTRNVAAI